jgi:succinoglycan biosynthesis transport protein ExoP
VSLANLYARKYIEFRRELDTKSIATAAAAIEKQIRRMRRDGLTSSQVYADLVGKQQQLSTAQTLQGSNALLVREASGAGQIAPQPKRSALLALGLGMILGLGLVFLIDTLDTRVRSVDDLPAALELPLLASIPPPSWRLRRRRMLVMLDDPNSAAAEPFRILRTSLELSMPRDCRTIMVTSALEEEGKSTTAANLAIALARTGRHVVLVDLDLHRPSLGGFFDLKGRPGISDLVFQRASVEDAAARLTFGGVFQHASVEYLPLLGNEHGNGKPATGVLEVIGAGTLPPNPGDFIATSRLDAELELLRHRADLVIVDGPPLLLAGDALALSSKLDGMVVVARLNAFKQREVNELNRVLASCPAAKLGLVVTGAPIRRSGYYGYRAREAGDQQRQFAE